MIIKTAAVFDQAEEGHKNSLEIIQGRTIWEFNTSIYSALQKYS